MAKASPYAGLTPQQMVQKMLTEGTGRRSRNPNPSLGTFKIRLHKFRQVKSKKAFPQVVGGQMQMVEFEVVSAYVLEGKVLESSNPTTPVGSVIDVYFSQDGQKDWQLEANAKDMVDFVFAFYRCYGVVTPDDAMYNALLTNESAVKGTVIQLGTVMKGERQAKPGEAAAPKPRDPSNPLDHYRNWTAVPNTPPEAQARAAEIDAGR